MRSKFQELQDTLSGFVDQNDNLLLVINTTDLEMAYLLKALEGMDDASASDLFLVFGEPFTDGPAYATAIMRNLRAQMEVARAGLIERGEEPLTPLPALCDDEAASPAVRLRAAIDHAASWLPAGGGHRMVWGFLPMRIDDPNGLALVVREFILWRGPEPWMKGLRVMARDDRAHPCLFPGLRTHKAPGVLLYDLDLSPTALNDGLVREAADRSAPVADRMQALLQLAGIDFAYQRYREAIQKYKVLNNYYAAHKAPVMQAVVLQGVGDALRQMQEHALAKEIYHRSLALVMHTQALPVLLNLTFAIGDVSLVLEDYRDAEGFMGLAAQIADKMGNPFVQADALEKQGMARDRRRDLAGAVLVWQEAAALSKTCAYPERQQSVLQRLIRAYKTLGQRDARRACEAELQVARRANDAAASTAHVLSLGAAS
jgi:tetratricopeptide (TPR) repeat protein